jgi:hypothetical protein
MERGLDYRVLEGRGASVSAIQNGHFLEVIVREAT